MKTLTFRSSTMPNIVIYKTPTCPYCNRAIALLHQRGVSKIEQIDISQDSALRDEMMKRSGGRKTVPQIFIGTTHVGGFDDLSALDKAGGLDALLKTA
jgi:glutaredoxin 3